MREFSVALTDDVAEAMRRHLARPDGQEDVCLGLYRPSTGRRRDSAILYDWEPPNDGERLVDGNVSFTTEYLRRVIARAVGERAGVAILHSHRGMATGWQRLSPDDFDGEQRHARVVHSAVSLPLVGMTLAPGDGTWSARRWLLGQNVRVQHAGLVRVVGKRLAVSVNPEFAARSQDSQVRTVSFWGDLNQQAIASLTVAIIGLGSVGSIVAELLARTGVRRLILIDYDVVKTHNLDRTISATSGDIGRVKVEVAAERLRAIATAENFDVEVVNASVVESDGFSSVLDADVTFSCVDRPWARHVLNRAAYSHLIPVIDGGVLVLFRPGGEQMLSANWAVHASGPGRACLICQRAYTTEQVSLEQTGLLESEHYIQGLPDDSPLKRRENIIALSASVASFEVLQLIAMVSGLLGLSDPGQQRYSYYPGNVRLERVATCEAVCATPAFLAQGDYAYAGLGVDPALSALRSLVATQSSG